jgi:hypothetical protein
MPLSRSEKQRWVARGQTKVAFRSCERTNSEMPLSWSERQRWLAVWRQSDFRGPPPQLVSVLGFLDQDITEIERLARFHGEISADFDSRLFSA